MKKTCRIDHGGAGEWTAAGTPKGTIVPTITLDDVRWIRVYAASSRRDRSTAPLPNAAQRVSLCDAALGTGPDQLRAMLAIELEALIDEDRDDDGYQSNPRTQWARNRIAELQGALMGDMARATRSLRRVIAN